MVKIWILVAVYFFFYFRTIWYGTIIDDQDAQGKGATEKTTDFWLNLKRQFGGTYIVNTRVSHSFNFVIHLINCLLVYWIFGYNDVSFMATLLFMLNPVNNQVSLWLSGRAYGTATTLLLIGFVLLPVFPLFYGLAFGWSINVFFAPLIFLFTDYKLMALVLPLVAYICRKRFVPTIVNRSKTVTPEMKTVSLKKLILFFKTYAYYFLHCLFPVRIGMCHEYLHSYGLSKEETEKWYKLDKYFYFGIALLLSVIAIIATGNGSEYLGIIWFTIFIMQWCNLMVINHLITERYTYIANIGLMVLLSQLTYATPLIWVILAFYATRLWYFTPVYKDCLGFWKSNTENFPEVAMGYNQYGLESNKYGNVGTGFDIFLRGVQYRKQDFRLNYNIANLLAGQGRWDIIKEFIVRAEEGLDKNNNYELWKGHVDKIKNACIERGVFNTANPMLSTSNTEEKK